MPRSKRSAWHCVTSTEFTRNPRSKQVRTVCVSGWADPYPQRRKSKTLNCPGTFSAFDFRFYFILTSPRLGDINYALHTDLDVPRGGEALGLCPILTTLSEETTNDDDKKYRTDRHRRFRTLSVCGRYRKQSRRQRGRGEHNRRSQRERGKTHGSGTVQRFAYGDRKTSMGSMEGRRHDGLLQRRGFRQIRRVYRRQ